MFYIMCPSLDLSSSISITRSITLAVEMLSQTASQIG